MLSILLQGISIGFLLTVIPVYISETSVTSVTKFRGREQWSISIISSFWNFLSQLFCYGIWVVSRVCIWLVLSEVFPVHIRDLGISVVLVSKALIESMFIPRVLYLTHNYGYAPVLYWLCTSVIFYGSLYC